MGRVSVLLGLFFAVIGLTAFQAKSQTSLDQALIGAIKKGDVAAVTKLLEKGASPDVRETKITKPDVATDQPGGLAVPADTALMLAIQGDFDDVAKLLILKGANVNQTGEADYTALFSAARRRNSVMAELLISAGADLDHRNVYGDTPIVFSANEGDLKTLKVLLDAGADINGGSGWTPLMQAAYLWRAEMVEFLLERGADPNFHRPQYMSPLQCAEAQRANDIAAILRKAGATGTSKEIEYDREAIIAQMVKERDEELKARAIKYADLANLTDEDRAVILAFVKDLHSYEGKWFAAARDENTGLILINETAGAMSVFTDSQMNHELEATQAIDVTLEMRHHLINRNFRPVSLADLELPNTNVWMKSPADVPRGRFASRNDLAAARAWVQVYLPGLDAARNKAVVRFRFGPSSHGAAGTYLLEKMNGAWTVSWRDFALYA